MRFRVFLIFCTLTLLVYGALLSPRILESLSLWSGWIQKDISSGSTAALYNSTLILAQADRIDEAWQMISLLWENHTDIPQERRYELLGDIQYMRGVSREMIIDSYQRAYSLHPHPRLAKKLQYLHEWEMTAWSENTHTASEQSHSLDDAVSEAMRDIRRDQSDRGDMMNMLPFEYHEREWERWYFRSLFEGHSWSSYKDW